MFSHDEHLRIMSRIDRRGFLGLAGITGIGLAGCAGGLRQGAMLMPGSGKTQQAKDTSVVSIAKTANERRQLTYDSLKPLQEEVKNGIGSKNVVIKVNAGFPSEDHRIHSTYPDQVRGIIDFLREFYDGPISIAEGVGSSPTGNMLDGYELFGISAVANEYDNITLVDANLTPLARKYIHQFNERPQPIDIIAMYFDPNNYIISAARSKTHNAVVATFSLKNIVMGSPVGQSPNTRSQKNRMHGGWNGPRNAGGQELSYNLFRLALEGVYPDLGVVDALTGIEGDGPWDGPEIPHGISVASTDFVACDRICTEVTGTDPFYMKYLEWCGMANLGNWDLEKIQTIGANPEDVFVQYEQHPRIESQVGWIDELFERP